MSVCVCVQGTGDPTYSTCIINGQVPTCPVVISLSFSPAHFLSFSTIMSQSKPVRNGKELMTVVTIKISQCKHTVVRAICLSVL